MRDEQWLHIFTTCHEGIRRFEVLAQLVLANESSVKNVSER